MKKGFNWGQLFHALQLEYQLSGYAPKDFIQWLQDNFPADLLQHVRFSGTMSNTMLLDVPGYNHQQHTQQISNQKRRQPTESYLYPFVELYNKLGCKSLSFTINSHVVHAEGERGLERMLEAFRFVYRNTNVTAIELENEGYYYHSLTGLAGGSPNLAERIELAGVTGVVNAKAVELAVRNKINGFLDTLEYIIKPALQDYMLPMGVSVGYPTNMRERLWNECVLNRNFYNFLVPHIYITGSTRQQQMVEITNRLNAVRKPGVPLHVTEFNWNYAQQAAGPSDPEAFRAMFFDTLAVAGVKEAYFHCLSQGRSTYSWIQR